VTGAALRLGRLFRASGRAFVTAFDHGTTLRMPMSGPGPREVLSTIVESGPDGVLLSAGMLSTNTDLFARRGAPVPVVRADWTVVDDDWKAESGEHHRVVVTPAEAVAMGAGAICMYLIGGPADGEMFAGNVAAVAKAAHEADRVGIPLIVEATLWGSRHADKKDPEAVQHMCRIAYELGAHAIKTEFTGDVDTMRQVIDAVGVPVLTLGGARGAPDAVETAARDAIAAGAKGLIFGRNVWAADDPVTTTKTLLDIVHDSA
jgi:DhnA family fructose-bisphosphate aldolase class Ia